MDLRLYARVLWRFKPIVLMGLVLATTLALLSAVRISADGVHYRQSELWSSTTRLGVTQTGFPWGRLFAQGAAAGQETPEQQAARLKIPVADPNRLNNLAVLYAELAMSDPVRRLMRRDGPIGGRIIATALVSGDNRIMLPLVDLMAISTSPRAAVELAARSAKALQTYVREQQRVNKVPAADRVVVEQLVKPKGAKLFQPRPRTMPIVIFLAVMLAVVGLVFVLENVRPRVRALPEPAEAELRRTA